MKNAENLKKISAFFTLRVNLGFLFQDSVDGIHGLADTQVSGVDDKVVIEGVPNICIKVFWM